MYKKEKFGEFIFITASLFIFGIAALAFFLVKFNLVNAFSENNSLIVKRNRPVNDFDLSDPYITKVRKEIVDGPQINNNDPSVGSETAKVTIVQFSDYECQYCQEQKKIISSVLQKYADKVRYIRKDFPDSDINSKSFQASMAGRCAAEQGKFWEYNDLLYKNSKQLSTDTAFYINLASELELNDKRFNVCMSNSQIADLINNNIIEARSLEINGIPFLFINKQEVIGEISVSEIERLIELELNKD